MELTKQCIDSIVINTPEFNNIQLIIIDNASTDGTNSYLSELKHKWGNVQLVSNTENLGFAKACNQGIKASKAKYTILLNNDIIVTKGWLSNMLKEAESSPNIGIVGSRLLYPNSDIIQHIGVKFAKYGIVYPYHYSKLRSQRYVPESEISSDVDCVTFASVLIKEEVFERIGLLDEEYRNSYEDVDFCIRAKESGFRIRYCADSLLYHFESQRPHRNDYDRQNFELFNRKWEAVLEKYCDNEKGVLELYDIWAREEIQKNPNNIYMLFQLCNFSKQLDRWAEYGLFQQEFDEKISKYKNLGPILSIIIPTHNKWEVTNRCLQKIFETIRNLNFEIIIVDNNSTDVTLRNLEVMENSGLVRVIRNNPEKTYAESNNQGAKVARGKYLVFMNNDILPFENWSEKIIEIFENHPEVGIQGAKLVYPNGLIQHSGIVFRKLRNGQKHHYHIYLGKQGDDICVSKSREMQAVTGAFLAIRRELFELVQGFDEYYHFGHEDLDICLAVRKLGYKVWYNSEVCAIHLESATKKLKGLEKFALKLNDPNSIDYKNYIYFHRKWGDFVQIDDNKYYQEDKEFNPFTNV